MTLTFQRSPNEVGQSISEVDFLSSYLNQTTSEENIRTRHTRIRARHTHKFRVFCLHFLHLLGHPLKIIPSGERFRPAGRAVPKRRMSFEQCRGEKTSVK